MKKGLWIIAITVLVVLTFVVAFIYFKGPVYDKGKDWENKTVNDGINYIMLSTEKGMMGRIISNLSYGRLVYVDRINGLPPATCFGDMYSEETNKTGDNEYTIYCGENYWIFKYTDIGWLMSDMQTKSLVGGCGGVYYIHWNECCNNWVRDNNISHVQCVGNWTVENNTCSWICA